MKISLKIFVFTYCVMMCITVTVGFMLVNYLYKTDLAQAQDSALDSNEILYTYVSTLDGIPDEGYSKYSFTNFSQKMAGIKGREKNVFIGNYNSWKEQVVLDGYNNIKSGQVVSNIIQKDGKTLIQVTSRCDRKYIINYYDITEIINRRDSNYNLYRRAIIISSMIIAVVLYIFARYITKPVEKLTDVALRISGGDYSVRTNADYKKMKSYEAAKLGETLNTLAENTEKHIAELEDLARKNKDFVGNFTHEIKTPMTSIIGYADLLRSYDLAPDKRREYSNFIYTEGKRLEQLSVNLLDLIVVGKNEFEKKNIITSLFFKNLKESVRFIGEKYNIDIRIKYDDAGINIEQSLISTAVINLADNACKATDDGSPVSISGEISEDGYEIIVSDHGIGIPDGELDKIMEPFYMVDKSRARKQGGAGLGLALCLKIVELHGGTLSIEGNDNGGTKAVILLPFTEDGSDDGGDCDEVS